MYTRVPRGHPVNATRLLHSRSPLVCESRCRTSRGRGYSGSSGMYFRTGSSMLIFPSFIRSAIAVEVNCFATEPDSRIVDGVIGAFVSRSAMPYPRMSKSRPLWRTPTAQPGVCVELNCAKTRSAVASSVIGTSAPPRPRWARAANGADSSSAAAETVARWTN